MQQPFTSAVMALSVGNIAIPNDILGIGGSSSLGGVTIRSCQRAETPSLVHYSADPFRLDRADPATVVSTTLSSNDRSLDFIRTKEDRKCCVYYKIVLDIPGSSQPIVALMELSPEYPIRPPQFLLTSRFTIFSIQSCLNLILIFDYFLKF